MVCFFFFTSCLHFMCSCHFKHREPSCSEMQSRSHATSNATTKHEADPSLHDSCLQGLKGLAGCSCRAEGVINQKCLLVLSGTNKSMPCRDVGDLGACSLATCCTLARSHHQKRFPLHPLLGKPSPLSCIQPNTCSPCHKRSHADCSTALVPAGTHADCSLH
ncbi:hypothetical protein COO60DRAFT_1505712 [Scenedesmus sp. NREL 46B-D3]|nr:hypothetical protein COO60DRAFT_1505712 [Scenedesmus sp. NREL 46B-D3]